MSTIGTSTAVTANAVAAVCAISPFSERVKKKQHAIFNYTFQLLSVFLNNKRTVAISTNLPQLDII